MQICSEHSSGIYSENLRKPYCSKTYSNYFVKKLAWVESKARGFFHLKLSKILTTESHQEDFLTAAGIFTEKDENCN
jgi:hypothetical protein